MERRDSHSVRRRGWWPGFPVAAALLALGWWSWSQTSLPDLSVKSVDQHAELPRTYNPDIRVCLTRSAASSLNVRCDGPLVIRLVGSTRVIWQGDKIPAATASSTVNGIQIGSLQLSATRIELVPGTPKGVWVNGHEYRGTVQLFRMRSGRLLAVNVLPLEDYLASVVDSEMPIEFGEQARCVQCVVSRTYALYQMQERRTHPYFDLFATTNSQRYLGKNYPGPKGVLWAGESDNSRQIVRKTRGVICTSNGTIFCTYFSSVCGGATSQGSDLFSDADAVLERVPCEWCQEADLCRWTRQVPLKEFLKQLNRYRGVNLGPSLSITDESRSTQATRPVDVIEFRDGEESVLLTHWELRQQLLDDRLPSPSFTAELQGEVIVFHGRGHGHGAGCCQWGARGQARAGRTFPEILQHYYPGCELVRLVDTSSAERASDDFNVD